MRLAIVGIIDLSIFSVHFFELEISHSTFFLRLPFIGQLYCCSTHTAWDSWPTVIRHQDCYK